ncbi:restriction endonuclease subunit S [Nocardia sp. NPDC002869]|uniref:restriction endonuclease subunit S n=1 Tax=Nocardia sp. NPDC002869 TaxID=3161032 RepID=UPI00398CA2B2
MSEWRSTTLSDLCRNGVIQTGPFGSQLHAEDYTDVGVPVVMPVNLVGGRINPSGIARISGEDVDRLSRHRMQPGDVVYSRRGDITRCALITDHEEGWLCGTGCLLVRPSPDICHRWLFYWLSTPTTHDWLIRHSVGATMMNLNTNILSALPVDLPPLVEQKRIASVLGAFDDLIETNRKLIDRLVETARASFKVFVPTAAEVLTYADVVDVGGGGTPKTQVPEFWGGNVHWATPKDMTALPSPFLFDTSRQITDAGLASCSSALYSIGSILMTSRATIGVFALAQVPTAVNQGFIVVTPRSEVDRTYVLLEMMSRVPDYLNHANGSTFLEISRGRFKALPVVWPSDADRERLHRDVSPLLVEAAALQVEIADLIRTRDELLPLLMSGKIRVDKALEVALWP